MVTSMLLVCVWCDVLGLARCWGDDLGVCRGLRVFLRLLVVVLWLFKCC